MPLPTLGVPSPGQMWVDCVKFLAWPNLGKICQCQCPCPGPIWGYLVPFWVECRPLCIGKLARLPLTRPERAPGQWLSSKGAARTGHEDTAYVDFPTGRVSRFLFRNEKVSSCPCCFFQNKSNYLFFKETARTRGHVFISEEKTGDPPCCEMHISGVLVACPRGVLRGRCTSAWAHAQPGGRGRSHRGTRSQTSGGGPPSELRGEQLSSSPSLDKSFVASRLANDKIAASASVNPLRN